MNKINSLNKLIMVLIKLQLEIYSLKSLNLHRDIVKIKITVGTIQRLFKKMRREFKYNSGSNKLIETNIKIQLYFDEKTIYMEK